MLESSPGPAMPLLGDPAGSLYLSELLFFPCMRTATSILGVSEGGSSRSESLFVVHGLWHGGAGCLVTVCPTYPRGGGKQSTSSPAVYPALAGREQDCPQQSDLSSRCPSHFVCTAWFILRSTLWGSIVPICQVSRLRQDCSRSTLGSGCSGCPGQEPAHVTGEGRVGAGGTQEEREVERYLLGGWRGSFPGLSLEALWGPFLGV